MSSIAIIGASGHGKVVAAVAAANGYDLIEFYDDKWPKATQVETYPIVGTVKDALSREVDYDHVAIGIGNSEIRASLQNKLSREFPALVHPSAVIGSNVKMDTGTIVMPGVIINSSASLGKGVIVNSAAVIEHDCYIGDFSHVCPNAVLAGGVYVGEYSWIGLGASVIQMIKIGSHATVGAGSVVIRDVKQKQTVVGNPATDINLIG